MTTALGTLVGVISDTHGLMRPEAIAVLSDCDLIVHAGDIGKPEVLAELGRIARVVAVRGNIDRGAWADTLPNEVEVEVEGLRLYVLHNGKELDRDPVAAGFRVVISGHSHQPRSEHRDGVLYLNPGSAGPRRFTLPIALAKLRLGRDALEPEMIVLDP